MPLPSRLTLHRRQLHAVRTPRVVATRRPRRRTAQRDRRDHAGTLVPPSGFDIDFDFVDHHDLVARVLSVRCVRAARRRPPRTPAACAAQPCRRAPARVRLAGAAARRTYAAPPARAQERRHRDGEARARQRQRADRVQRLCCPMRGNRWAPLLPCARPRQALRRVGVW